MRSPGDGGGSVSGWMLNIDFAARNWAARGAIRSDADLAEVLAAVESAWREGVPTAAAIAYAKRRVAHHRVSA